MNTEEEDLLAYGIAIVIYDGKSYKHIPLDNVYCVKEFDNGDTLPAGSRVIDLYPSEGVLGKALIPATQIPRKVMNMLDFLRAYVPDSCWVSIYDIFKMADIYFPGSYVKKNSLRASVHKLEKDGVLESKWANPIGGPNYKLYKRVENTKT